MLTLSTRIWTSFITVLTVGLVMSYVITQSGNMVNHTTQNLVMVQLPRLALIKRLRASLTEHERLLYEYYTTTNRDLVWPKIMAREKEFNHYLANISDSFAGKVMSLPKLYGEIKLLRDSLDKNLGGTQVDWDQARFDLANLTLTGQSTENILIALTDTIQKEAWQGAESTQTQISNIFYLVISFTVFIILAALLVGYYTQANIKKTAKRRALAKFPERNPNPIINLNWQGEILFSNPACHQLLTSIGADNENIENILPPGFFNNLKKWQQEHQSQLKFDALIGDRHIHYSLSLLPDLGSCHLYMEDVTAREKAQAQLKYQALHDVHTGLPNRRQFEDIINQKIGENDSFSVLFIDIDRFKLITSSQGYHIGDLTIKYMGERLQQLCGNLQKHVQTFRLEASTFCIIINALDQAISLEVAQAIQKSMDEPLCVKDHRYYLNLSMGICHYPQDANDARSLITHGNAALNHAQRQGDSCEVYDDKLHSAQQNWLPIESGMRMALEKQQFALHYQAKVDAQTTNIKGAEALIRWQADDGTLISPGVFIPVAEQTGLIIQIGQWVIEEGFRQAKRFSDQKQDIQLAINISARQFQHRHFLQQLQIALEQTQADPSKIELEITESLIMENADHSISIMKKLKDMGFALAIDDFGTGYSSLSYLKQFPIDSLKVDQAFVKHLENDEDDKGIVSAIVSLAQHLHLKTIAEGVETPGQWHFLKELGCDYIQGYLFSKPDVVGRLIKPVDGPLQNPM